jgi:hypothetical protein
MAILAAAAGLIATTVDRGALDAADAKRPGELITSRQCDRCGFGTMRLETPHRHGSVSVGFLTDEELARISALLGMPGKGVAERWLGAADHARSPRAQAAMREEGAGSGGDEPRFMNDTAAAIFEALTKGGGSDGTDSAVTFGPSSLQLINVDEVGWVSLTLRAPQFAYQTIYSP